MVEDTKRMIFRTLFHLISKRILVPTSSEIFMFLKRFDTITAALSFTNVNKPIYIYMDKFWEVREMIA